MSQSTVEEQVEAVKALKVAEKAMPTHAMVASSDRVYGRLPTGMLIRVTQKGLHREDVDRLKPKLSLKRLVYKRSKCGSIRAPGHLPKSKAFVVFATMTKLANMLNQRHERPHFTGWVGRMRKRLIAKMGLIVQGNLDANQMQANRRAERDLRAS